jgi:hypothetical protein
MPIASLEVRALTLLGPSVGTRLIGRANIQVLFGRKQYKPYFEAGAVDVAIVDCVYNGFWEAVKIAALADVYEVNCAAHNYHGHLGTAISAHFCAAIPNFRACEVDIDDVPWKDSLFVNPPKIENGCVPQPVLICLAIADSRPVHCMSASIGAHQAKKRYTMLVSLLL